MENYIQAEDYELWMLIKNGPLIPKVTDRPQVYGCCSVDQVSSHRDYRELLGYNLF